MRADSLMESFFWGSDSFNKGGGGVRSGCGSSG